MIAPVDILYADEGVVAVNKPAGLAVHRSHMIGRDDAYLIDLVRDLTGRTLYLAHRLDRATSGVVLMAASREIAADLGRQFMARTVGKRYLGVVRGWLDDAGAIDHPLAATRHGEARPAITRWHCLARGELSIAMGPYAVQRYSLAAIEPVTGRHQQIRRHFHHVHHPLIGDTTHGRGEHNRLFRQHLGVHRLLLHAGGITFTHPVTGCPLTVRAPLDDVWRRVLARFGWERAAAGAAASPAESPGDAELRTAAPG